MCREQGLSPGSSVRPVSSRARWGSGESAPNVETGFFESKDSHREVVSDRFLREQDGGLGTAGLASAVVGSCASFAARSTPLFPISTYAAHDRRLSRRA
jgi:hypothetical protein